jgi:hypothetical protein
MLPPPINAIFILITSIIVILLFRYSRNEQKNSFSDLTQYNKKPHPLSPSPRKTLGVDEVVVCQLIEAAHLIRKDYNQ